MLAVTVDTSEIRTEFAIFLSLSKSRALLWL